MFDAITQGDFQVYVDEFLFRYNFAENNNFCCKSIKKCMSLSQLSQCTLYMCSIMMQREINIHLRLYRFIYVILQHPGYVALNT